MGEKVALLVLAILFLAGCIGGLADIYGEKPSTAPTEADLETIADIKTLLVETGEETSSEVKALLEAKLIELEAKLGASEVYQSGKETAVSLWKLLAALGVVGGGGVAAFQRNKRKSAEFDSGEMAYGLHILEEAILKAGDKAAPIKANIKAEGINAVHAVDKARKLANGG